MNTVREMAVQGKPVRAIARELGLARNTVRKYVREPAVTWEAAHTHELRRPSKLDPYKAQIEQWITQDHLYSCETMFRRLPILQYRSHPLRDECACIAGEGQWSTA